MALAEKLTHENAEASISQGVIVSMHTRNKMTFSKSFSIPREDYFKFSKFVVSRLRKSGNQSILNLKNIILWFATTLMFMFIFQSFNDNDFNIDWFSFGIGAFPFLVFFLVFALETVKLQKLSAPKESGIVFRRTDIRN